jgi:hypothetical protein
VEDSYPDVYAKLALAITSTQLAKQNAVEEFGIGEDLPFMFMGWRGDQLSVLMVFGRSDMKQPVVKRIPKVGMVCDVLRSVYWVDSITFIAEGFMSKAPWELKGKELTEAFVANDAKVSECITSSHVSTNRYGEPEVMLMSTPYNTLLGKHVVWGDQAAFSQGIGTVFKDAPILNMVMSGLRENCERMDEEEQEQVVGHLFSNGISVQEFEPPASIQ